MSTQENNANPDKSLKPRKEKDSKQKPQNNKNNKVLAETAAPKRVRVRDYKAEKQRERELKEQRAKALALEQEKQKQKVTDAAVEVDDNDLLTDEQKALVQQAKDAHPIAPTFVPKDDKLTAKAFKEVKDKVKEKKLGVPGESDPIFDIILPRSVRQKIADKDGHVGLWMAPLSDGFMRLKLLNVEQETPEMQRSVSDAQPAPIPAADSAVPAPAPQAPLMTSKVQKVLEMVAKVVDTFYEESAKEYADSKNAKSDEDLAKIKALQEEIAGLGAVLQGKDAEMSVMRDELKKSMNAMTTYQGIIAQKEQQIEEVAAADRVKDQDLAALRIKYQDLNAKTEETIKEALQKMAEENAGVSEKDKEIEELKASLESANTLVKELDGHLKKKNAVIDGLKNTEHKIVFVDEYLSTMKYKLQNGAQQVVAVVRGTEVRGIED